jgi:hypothetical protein
MTVSTGRRARLSTTVQQKFAALAFAGAACFAAASFTATAAHAQALPQNAYSSPQTCAVTQPQLAGWFGGAITPNGPVSPASSVTFPTNNTNCDFYQWSARMFLWLTGPAPNSPWVFDSQIFYSVSPADANGNRILTQQGWGLAQSASMRAAQAGPNGLPVVVDKSGMLREVLNTAIGKGGVSLVPDKKGKLVPVGSVKVGANKAASLLDAKGQTIQTKPNLSAVMLPKMVLQRAGLSAKPSAAAKTKLLAKLTASHVLLQIRSANGKQQFIDSATGAIVDLGVGQAGDSSVLITQGNSIIYYQTLVNDVYAYYLTAFKNGCSPNFQPPYSSSNLGNFPTTATGVSNVSACFNNMQFPDAQAAAMELKLSWVDAATIPQSQLGSYIVLPNVTVPLYVNDPSQPPNTVWLYQGPTTKNLALVAMHVVGSVQGHPEMLWATFEHMGNAPFNTYSYYISATQTNTITFTPTKTDAQYLIATLPFPGAFNVEQGSYCITGYQYNPTVCSNFTPPAGVPQWINQASTDVTISPGQAYVVRPWGADPVNPPNPQVNSAMSNTQIIALDNSVINQLATGDIRKNYFQTGTSWTIGGNAPTCSYSTPCQWPTPPANYQPGTGNVVGTSELINSTLETYQQTNNDSVYATDCMGCHSNGTAFAYNSPPLANTQVSHIFSGIVPLTGMTSAAKPANKPMAKPAKKKTK